MQVHSNSLNFTMISVWNYCIFEIKRSSKFGMWIEIWSSISWNNTAISIEIQALFVKLTTHIILASFFFTQYNAIKWTNKQESMQNKRIMNHRLAKIQKVSSKKYIKMLLWSECFGILRKPTHKIQISEQLLMDCVKCFFSLAVQFGSFNVNGRMILHFEKCNSASALSEFWDPGKFERSFPFLMTKNLVLMLYDRLAEFIELK